MNKILINDIKSGAVITTHSGHKETVADNKKGLIRNVICQTMGTDLMEGPSSDYAYNWKTAKIDGEDFEVVMTPRQEDQSEAIKTFLGDK